MPTGTAMVTPRRCVACEKTATVVVYKTNRRGGIDRSSKTFVCAEGAHMGEQLYGTRPVQRRVERSTPRARFVYVDEEATPGLAPPEQVK